MSEEDAGTLIGFLRSRRCRYRTGILLLKKEHLGEEANIAARLGIDAVDYKDLLLGSLPEGTSFVGISAEAEEERLDFLANQQQGSDCTLVANFDLALSRLGSKERQRLWVYLFRQFPHRQRALLLAIPEAASHLLPNETDINQWQEGKRIAAFTWPED